jgi:alpha-beta hydrolase superfamily lysophospholipase
MTAFLILLALVIPLQEEYVSYTIPGEGGSEIPIRLYSPPFSGAPMILVVQDWGETIDNWHPVAKTFKELGFSVLVYTHPGHEKGSMEKYSHTDRDIAGYQERLQMVYSYALGRTKVVHILGSGLGANLAVLFAEESGIEGRIAAVSPGLNYRDLIITPDIAMKVADSIMLVASQEDTYSAWSVRNMMQLFQKLPEKERPQSVLYSNVGHGVWLLKRLPESIASITRWYSDFSDN